MAMTTTDSDAIANDIVMQFREEFLADCQSRLETLDACIVSLLASDDGDTDRLVEFRREVHSLKGYCLHRC